MQGGFERLTRGAAKSFSIIGDSQQRVSFAGLRVYRSRRGQFSNCLVHQTGIEQLAASANSVGDSRVGRGRANLRSVGVINAADVGTVKLLNVFVANFGNCFLFLTPAKPSAQRAKWS